MKIKLGIPYRAMLRRIIEREYADTEEEGIRAAINYYWEKINAEEI